MDNFLRIITMPDNVPIVGMVVFLAWLLPVWWKQARRHDALIEEGKEDQVLPDMRR